MRHARYAGCVAFLLPFFIYLLTLCPTVHWGDSGELITAAYTLGIPHPPGHPLYAIVGKLFTLIPIGSIAYRVNLMSAFFGAVSCYLVYKITFDRLGDSPWRPAAALSGALFFAFAPTVWDQSTVAETTTLHCAFMMLLTFIGFRLASGKIVWRNETSSLVLFSFLYGLSMTNHVAGVFFVPSFIYLFLAVYGKKIFAPRLLFKMIGACLVGALVYLYLPIRSLADPPLDWGNPETLENFWWVVTARQFAPNLKTEVSLLSLLWHLVVTGQNLLHQYSIAGCALGILGLPYLLRKQRQYVIFSFLVIAILCYIGLNAAFISAYFVPALALLAVAIGAGVQRSIEAALASFERKEIPLSALFQKAICGLLAAGFILPLGLHFDEMDRSADYYALRYGHQVMDSLPEDSILFTGDGYALFILWYLTFCEGERPDILIIKPGWLVSKSPLASQVLEQYPSLRMSTPERMRENGIRGKTVHEREFLAIQTILDENATHRPVYWGLILEELPFFDHLDCRGIVYAYSREPVMVNEESLAEAKEFWETELRLYGEHPEMKKTALIRDIYPVELNNQGLMFEQLGRDDLARWSIEHSFTFSPDFPLSHYNFGRLEARAGNYERAICEYEKAISGNPYMAVAYYNMGNAYRNLNQLDEAFLAYRKASRYYRSYHEAMTAMGQLYALAGQHDDAIKEFQKSLDIEPNYPFALRGLVSSYLTLGKLQEARGALLKALQLDPDSAAGLFLLAKYNARMGDAAAAADALRLAIESGGNSFFDNAESDEDLKLIVTQLHPAGPSQ
jgi:Flp pilus assembly protein TadD